MVHYATLNVNFWWFVHVCTLFHKVVFPLHGKPFMENHRKRIHVLISIIGKQAVTLNEPSYLFFILLNQSGWFAPIFVVIMVLPIPEFQYKKLILAPEVCFPNIVLARVITIIAPEGLMGAIGVYFILVVLFEITIVRNKTIIHVYLCCIFFRKMVFVRKKKEQSWRL